MTPELWGQFLAYVILYSVCHLAYALLKWIWGDSPETKKDAETMPGEDKEKPDQTD